MADRSPLLGFAGVSVAVLAATAYGRGAATPPVVKDAGSASLPQAVSAAEPLPCAASVAAQGLTYKATVRRTRRDTTFEDVREEKPASRGACYRTGRDLLTEFLGDSAADGLRNSVRAPVGDVQLGLEVVIAILPDPLDSHLDWAYDAGLESIRRALEDAGFIIDRYWLPWQSEALDSTATAVGRATLRQARPGVLLFRSTNPSDTVALRLVYVVGEVPTAGVHKVALRTALDERRDLLADAGFIRDFAKPDTVRIVGPFFSGSARSLRRALNAWVDARGGSAPPVRILSGAATNYENQAALTDSARRIGFAATVHPVDAYVDVVTKVLGARLGIAPVEIAFLREATTQFGQLSSGAATDTGAAADTSRWLEIPFPMNISSLRAEYARHPVPQETAPGVGQSRGPRIPLDLTERAWSTESPRPFSDLTVVAADRALDEIAATLLAHRVRAVGIIATDVRDRIFLASEIRQRVRDVQLFIYQGSTLYARPDLNEQLRGTLVVSTYPLVLENQLWTGSARRQVVFMSDNAEGIYNAMLVQLGRDGAMVEYGPPDPPAEWVAAGDHRPPLWVTAVGRDALYPVTTLEPAEQFRDYTVALRQALPALRSSTHPIRRPDMPAMVSAAIALLLVTGLLQVSTPARPARLEPTDELDDATRGPFAQQASILLFREVYVWLRWIALSTAFGVLVLASLSVVAHGSKWPVLYTAALLVVVAAITIFFLFRGLPPAYRTVRESMRQSIRYALHGPPWSSRRAQLIWGANIAARFGVVLFGGVYLLASVIFLTQVISLQPADTSLFFHRATSLSSGVSPLLPLLLIASVFVVWCTWHLKRLALLSTTTAFEEHWATAAPAEHVGPLGVARLMPGSAPAPRERPRGWRARLRARLVDVHQAFDELHAEHLRPPAITDAVTAVRERLFLLIPGRSGAVALLTVVALGSWLGPQFRPTLEASVFGPEQGGLDAFTWLLRLGVLASIGATAWALYRLLAIWFAVQGCMSHLEDTRLLGAFGRLPGQLKRLTRLTPFDEPSSRMIDEALRARWSAMRRSWEQVCKSGGKPLPRMVAAYMTGSSHATWPRVRDAWTWRTELARPFTELCRVCEEAWEAWPWATDGDSAVGRASAGEGAERKADTERAAPECRFVPLLEECVTLYVVDYLEWAFRGMRNLAYFLLLSLVLNTLLLTGYPFPGQGVVKVVFLVLFAATVGALLFVITQTNRNAVVSRITGTPPGELTWDLPFLVNLLLFVVLPLVTLVSTEVPQVRELLFSWLTPALAALGKG
jgi:hypothetical protein